MTGNKAYPGCPSALVTYQEPSMVSTAATKEPILNLPNSPTCYLRGARCRGQYIYRRAPPLLSATSVAVE